MCRGGFGRVEAVCLIPKGVEFVEMDILVLRVDVPKEGFAGKLGADETASAHRRLSDDLNGGEALSATQRLECWQILQQHQNDWRQGAEDWSRHLFKQPSAPEKLAAFISKLKKIR